MDQRIFKNCLFCVKVENISDRLFTKLALESHAISHQYYFRKLVFAFNIDKNLKRLKIQMQRYLICLQEWFNKLRLSIAGKKCSFTIYSKAQVSKELTNKSFKLMISNEELPVNHNPKYLGVILDRNLNFNKQTN